MMTKEPPSRLRAADNGQSAHASALSNTGTLTLSTTYLDIAGTVTWTSGNVTLDTYTQVVTPMLLTVPENYTLTVSADTINSSSIAINNYGTVNWASDTSDPLTINNYNYIDWQTSNTAGLFYITNDSGYIILDGTTPLIDLSGTGSATEGAAYTLTLGAVSSDIPDTVTDYIVDWGERPD